MTLSFLRCKQITKHFNTSICSSLVLNTITITFTQNESYAIQGVSGTGKSTFMHLLAGLDQPSTGSIFFNAHDLSRMSALEHERFLQKNVGLLFQQPYLIKELTVLENVMVPGLIRGLPFIECRSRAQNLLEKVNLYDKREEYPGALSGGQQQRIALARALINKPDFLIADEPTGNLDEQTGRQMVALMVNLQKEWGMGIIVSTHDNYVAHAMSNQYTLEEGILKTNPMPIRSETMLMHE